MWNRRWFGLAAMWIAAIVGIGYALRTPEKYEAVARVYVDTQSLLRPVMAGLSIQPNLDQQAALVSRTLISRPNLEKLVTMANLDAGKKSVSDHNDLIENLAKALQLIGDPKTNSYFITYRDANPQRAKEVVGSLLQIFVESSLGDKREDTKNALVFLDEQIKRYEQSLQTAENRLKEFKLKYMGLAGQSGQGAGQDYFARMAKLGDDIANAKLELQAATQSRDSYRRGLAGEVPTLPMDKSGANGTVAPPEIDVRIAAQKTKLDELLRKYTDQHPDVVGTRRVIAELEEERRQEQLAIARNPGSAKAMQAMEHNPVFQKMRVSLADAEANVAALNARLASYESQYAQLKSSARMVPQVEAEYAQLNRDYDIQKKTYSDLLARRQGALMGADVQSTEAAQLRVIDPPWVSPQPVPPTRMTLLAAAFLVALGVGLLASFAANEILPTFHDARSLRDMSERPVLGTLSLLPSDAIQRKRRRNLWLFFGGVSSLIASFTAILALMLLVGRVA